MDPPRWDGLELYATPRTGLGVYATRPIAEGTVIATVEGPVEYIEYDEDAHLGSTWYGVGRNKWVAPPEGAAARWLNHACQPSARMRDPRTVVAARDISPGEEITIDYATTEEDPWWFLECKCDSPECRGVVKGEAKFES